MGYLTLVILLSLFTWLVYRNFIKTEISTKDLLFGWGIKILCASFFLYLFSYHYSNDGQPYGDVGNFLSDSEVIKEYGEKDPVGYLKLMIGVNADNHQILQTELSETNIWDYGATADNINDNRLIIRINSLIHFISFGNNWVHALIFAFLSFIGVLLIYKAFAHLIDHKKIFFYVLMTAPTIAFWGSAISKEAILIFAFGLFSFSLLKLLAKPKLIHVIFGLASIWMMVVNKPHFGLIIIPMSIIIIIARKVEFTKKAAFISTLAVLAGFLILCFTPSKINIVDRISYKQQDLINVAKGGIFFINDSAFCSFDYHYMDHFEYRSEEKLITAKESSVGEYKLFGEKLFHPFQIEPSTKEYEAYLVMPPSESYIETEAVNHSFVQLLKNTPSSLFNVLIRPLPTDSGSNFKYFIFAENIGFIIFLALAYFKRKTLGNRERAFIFYLSISAVVLFLIIGWTTPVIGALVRYKMAPQLLLILTAFILLKHPIKSKE